MGHARSPTWIQLTRAVAKKPLSPDLNLSDNSAREKLVLAHKDYCNHVSLICPAVRQGLGYPNIAVGHARPPFFNMIDQGVVNEPLFSFWLNRNHPEGAGGELVLGGMDSAHYTGEHAWCGLLQRRFSLFDCFTTLPVSASSRLWCSQAPRQQAAGPWNGCVVKDAARRLGCLGGAHVPGHCETPVCSGDPLLTRRSFACRAAAARSS